MIESKRTPRSEMRRHAPRCHDKMIDDHGNIRIRCTCRGEIQWQPHQHARDSFIRGNSGWALTNYIRPSNKLVYGLKLDDIFPFNVNVAKSTKKRKIKN